MAVDSGQMTGEQSSGGFFSNRRNLILAAVAVGGVAGLFFLMRGSGSGGGSGTATYSAQDLSIASLAQQLLQFRGESSIALNNLADNMESGFAAQTAAGADLKNAILGVGNQVTSTTDGILNSIAGLAATVGGNQQNLMQALSGLGIRLQAVQDATGNLSYQIEDLRTGVNKSVSNTEMIKWITTQGNQDAQMSVFNLARSLNPNITWDQIMSGVIGAGYNSPASVGAGGYRAVDMTRDASFDYDGVADHWSALMANGPVRYV